MIKKLVFPALFISLWYAFFISNDATQIASWVAIFLVWMVFMEDWFKLFSGGTLERLIAKSTNTLFKAISTWFFSTTIVQSSSLISVILISFLSAELITITQALGVVFGSNIWSTTTAWIVSTIWLKVKIAIFAMPMIIFWVLMKFSKKNSHLWIWNILLWLWFMFLWIDFMKEWFDAVKNTIDLSQYMIDWYLWIMLYVLVWAIATVVIQSSWATMAIIITALATWQISYIASLSLAIWANVGTTVTAAMWALKSNENWKRLAVAHFIFNVITWLVAIIFIYQLSDFVDYISSIIWIWAENFAMKLALFHTIFNILWVLIVAPFLKPLVRFLSRLFVSNKIDESTPLYLNETSIEFPDVAETAIKKEVINLFEKIIGSMVHAIWLHRTDIFKWKNNILKIIEEENKKKKVNIDTLYKEIFKPLYGEIINFASISQQKMDKEWIQNVGNFKFATRKLIESIKDIREIQKNINKYTKSSNSYIKDEYNFIRSSIAEILRWIYLIKKWDFTNEEKNKKIKKLFNRIEKLDCIENWKLDELIRAKKIDKKMATSLMNDYSFSYDISKNLIEFTNIIWVSWKQDV